MEAVAVPHLFPSIPAGNTVYASGQLAFDAIGKIEGDVLYKRRGYWITCAGLRLNTASLKRILSKRRFGEARG
jgi:hypothetical protein